MSADEGQEPERLSIELLESLRERWERIGAPIALGLAPGLSEDEIDSRMEPIGLTLPTEARLWFRWHDGVPHVVPPLLKEARWLGLYEFMQLAEAVEEYKKWIAISHEAATADRAGRTGDPEFVWVRAWFPFLSSGGGYPVVCDCAGDPADPAPIHSYHAEFYEESRRPVVQSFGTMVRWFVQAIDAGAWYYDQYRGQWGYEPQRVPPELRGHRLGLV
jgi:cell wall assembly regulator SMI1